MAQVSSSQGFVKLIGTNCSYGVASMPFLNNGTPNTCTGYPSPMSRVDYS